MNLNILFASAEVVPFSKTGGLADVAGALPKEIGKNNNVIVITPLYKSIDLSVYNPKEIGKKQITMGSISTTVFFKEISLNNIKYVFVSHPYYERENFYGYQDDNERFMLFNFAILEYLVLTKKKVEIIHINDWQSALVPYLLDTTYRHFSKLTDIKTLLSIHNLQYQGSFDKETYLLTNKPFDYTCIHFDRFNFLKTGIMTADFINTVSETYKNEIQTEYFGNTLDGALKSRKQDLYGILNGIDYSIYNPETDPHIPFKYNKNRFVSGKRENKTQLLKELKLDSITSIPLVGHIGRLATQKGIDLMMATLEEAITASNANYVFLGSGEEKYEKFFKDLMHKYPNRVYTYVGFSHALAQKIYAASDLLIMPSLFEPCGLSQMIAMRYGTLPVVRETGGLKDTVIPYNKYTNEGNGFSFANYNAHEFKDALLMGITLYNNNQHVFRLLQTQAMNCDFSLIEMGKNYLALYKKLLRK
ncbi:MAG: glycogen synthase [Acholeplasmatales bacterium]